jgi:Zn finger protein HypA/HybF involved in hydrogenase expression
MKRKKWKWTVEEVKSFIENKDGVLLTTIYVNALTKLHIRCKKDKHEWYPRWNDVRRGQWCPKCSGKAKKTISEVKNLVESKNGTLLSKIYKNAFGKLHIRCNIDKYEWYTTWHDLDSGYWCMMCAGKVPPTINYIKQFVVEKNGTLLSNKYENCYTKLHIRCNKDQNEWNPAWTDIQQGKWCPKCSSGKAQRLLQDILEEILKERSLSNYRGFGWLIGPGGKKQEIDIYFPKLKLAVEYDGEQHFKPIKFGNYDAKERLKYIKKLDINKNNKIKQHANDIEHFVRFSYKEPITKEYILQKLIDLRITR